MGVTFLGVFLQPVMATAESKVRTANLRKRERFIVV
jgi:hypothetical protein